MPRPFGAGAIALALMLAFPAAGPARAGEDAGAYLAARLALGAGDFATASAYLLTAIAGDPSNPRLLETAIVAQVARGEFARAEPLAQMMHDAGLASQRAAMVTLGARVRAGDWAAILAEPPAGSSGLSPLADALSRGWAQVGAGNMQAALAAFDAMARTPGMRPFALYHKALALALAGDFEGADAILSLPPGQGGLQPSRQLVMVRAQVLSQLDRGDEALALIEQTLGRVDDPALAALRDRLLAEGALPFTMVRDAAGGMAEAWYSIAAALVDETDDLNVLFHGRMALAMNPAHVDALFLVAQILERMERFDLARAAYGAVPPDHPLFPGAELGRADVLRRAGDTGAAIEVLTALARSHPDFAPGLARLGDALRIAGRHAESIGPYDRALDLGGADNPGRWRLLYSRGIAHFALDDWELAEADFAAAVALRPDQPSLLNFYGYSLVERHERLDEALSMIERAVALDPENGAYVDSLGWALFRLGRLDEAVETLERAAALESADPVVNDHLGDAYLAVGRQREARFQWLRALSFGPDEAEAEAIRRKLETGIAGTEAGTGGQGDTAQGATGSGG
ncbi:MAG: tetratricopeptide repeat protein [Rubellimicrobium sp.]|nr:tetratricopeptide repeat protein [Rubellimicrobium sp.]